LLDAAGLERRLVYLRAEPSFGAQVCSKIQLDQHRTVIRTRTCGWMVRGAELGYEIGTITW